jgi:predicted HTH domain antitoxin
MAAIELPDEVYDALRVPEDERESVVREELAVSLYARGALSFGKARELADLSTRGFHDLLGERRIERHYSEAELDEDVRYARG